MYRDNDNNGGVWEFKRSVYNGQFSFNKRGQTSSPRIIGDEPQPRMYARPDGRNTARNRYNSSVKMMPGDSLPDPWNEPEGYIPAACRLPIDGQVAAGRFEITIAYHEPGYDADADFVWINTKEVKVNSETFALRVRGQSMIDNDIDDGDIIIVQRQAWADDGDFVIAYMTNDGDPDGRVTLKRFYRHKHTDRIVLQPANQSLEPIHILPRKGDASRDDLDGVKIQGRVTAIIKTGV
jgi:SOS-response transcriptional repressor LexA